MIAFERSVGITRGAVRRFISVEIGEQHLRDLVRLFRFGVEVGTAVLVVDLLQLDNDRRRCSKSRRRRW